MDPLANETMYCPIIGADEIADRSARNGGRAYALALHVGRQIGRNGCLVLAIQRGGDSDRHGSRGNIANADGSVV